MNTFQQSVIQRKALISHTNSCETCVISIASDFLSFILTLSDNLITALSDFKIPSETKQKQINPQNVPKCSICNRLALRPLSTKINSSFDETDFEFFVSELLKLTFEPFQTSEIVWELKSILRTISLNNQPNTCTYTDETTQTPPQTFPYKQQFYQIGHTLNIKSFEPERILTEFQAKMSQLEHLQRENFEQKFIDLERKNAIFFREIVDLKIELNKLREYQKYSLKPRVTQKSENENFGEKSKKLRQFSRSQIDEKQDRKMKFDLTFSKQKVPTVTTKLYGLEQEIHRLKTANFSLTQKTEILGHTDEIIDNDLKMIFLTDQAEELSVDQKNMIFACQQLNQVRNGVCIVNSVSQEYVNYYLKQFDNVIQEVEIMYYQQLYEHFQYLKRYVLIERGYKFFKRQNNMNSALEAFRNSYSQEYEIYLFEQLKSCKTLRFLQNQKVLKIYLFSGLKGELVHIFNLAAVILISQGYTVQKNDKQIGLIKEFDM